MNSMNFNVTYTDDIPYVIYPDGRVYAAGGGSDANCTVSVCPVELSIYGYRPTLPGSAALIALFGACAVIQLGLGWRYKTWGFMAAMLLGCVDEMLGYAGRVMYYQNPWDQTGFIMQIVLITVGPVFFCAAIYFMIYQIINHIDPTVARFNPRLIYWVFITCDVVALILQGVGGGLSSSSNGSSTAGVNTALAGLCFQVATLSCFSLVSADYAFRSRHSWRSQKPSLRFRVFVSFLTLATLTMFIRCCYRVYELSEGYSRDSEALRDEPLFIGLESAMVIVTAYALIVAHPGFVFNRGRDGKEDPAAGEKDTYGGEGQERA